MSTTVTFDVGEFDEFKKRLSQLSKSDGPGAIVGDLAETWVETSRRVMGKDTHQLEDRTGVRSWSWTASRAEAVVEADTPYAGFHNYGTRFQGPNRFWDEGLEAAERRAGELEGQVVAEIRGVLTSGGVWNPRRNYKRPT